MSPKSYDEIFGQSWHVQGSEIRKRFAYVEVESSPIGEVTPEFIGQAAFDTVAKVFYTASGLTSDDWVSGEGNVQSYRTVTGLAALHIPASVTAIRTNGYASEGDGGNWPLAIEVTNSGTLQPWQKQSNGATRRWQLVTAEPRPQMFAVIGNVDDTAAVQAALDYGATRVSFPSANYAITQILPPSNCELVALGRNAKITAIGTSHVIYQNGISHSTVKGLILQGDNTPGVNGIYADNCNDIDVLRCRLDSFGTGDEPTDAVTAGIWMHSGCTDVSIHNNKLTGGTGKNGGNDIIVYSVSGDAIITGNRCYSANSNGIYTNSVGPDGRIIITGNICKNHKRHGILPVYGGTAYHWIEPVAVATTANITLSGEQTINGVLTAASRVLVKNQTAGAENGVYVSAAGAWARASDADTSTDLVGCAVPILGGTTLSGQVWVCATASPITVGTTSVSFAVKSNGKLYRADAVISDNVCIDCDSTGIFVNGDINGFTITGNVVYSCTGGGGNGYQLDGGIVIIGNGSFNSGHKIVANNYVGNSGKTSGGITRVIDTDGVANDPTRVCGIRMINADHCIVTGNVVDGSTGRGLNLYGGQFGSQVYGNTVKDCVLASIYIEATNTAGQFVTIKDNLLDQSVSDGMGIWHRGGTQIDNCIITGNTIIGKKATTAKTGMQFEGGNAVAGRISGNEMKNWDIGLNIVSTAMSGRLGTTLIMDGNRIVDNTVGFRYTSAAGGYGFYTNMTFTGNGTDLSDASVLGIILPAVSVSPRKVFYKPTFPVSGIFIDGDRCINSVPAVGQPKAWTYFSAAWNSEGNF
ncbi:right-handed parallel beta-helix repeat-containing protein [Mesorhizobium sp. M1233]